MKFLTDKDSADIMGEKARHVLVNESSPLDSSTGTPCAPTPLLFLGGSWRSSDKWNVIQSALSSDMWHQKALRHVPVPYSYILMLVLKLSEPTCGGSVSNYFHIFNCTDHSWVLDVCHRCVTPTQSKCYRGAVTWDWWIGQGVRQKSKQIQRNRRRRRRKSFPCKTKIASVVSWG